MPSRVQKGDVAVLLLSARLVEAGLVVLKPLCEALPFDLAVYEGGVEWKGNPTGDGARLEPA